MKTSILSIFFSICLMNTQAQRCAFGMGVDPEKQKMRLERFQEALERSQATSDVNARIADEIITIPVVVHIVHNNALGQIGGKGNTNVSDEQVLSQITVLNEDYRRKPNTLGFNTNPVGADMEIEFVLASVDPDGLPTNGITRNYLNKTKLNVYRDLELIANQSHWPSDQYLNVYVVDFSSTFLGYGEFPRAEVDGLDLESYNELIDAVFVDYQVFGRKTGTANSGIYSFGRTLTHEIGHWLGLLHTWGDTYCGTDYVDDTPVTEYENDTDTCYPMYSKCSGKERTLNMIENYMDYSPDSCMNVFTQDQKNRVRQILSLSKQRRRLVLNSQYLIPKQETAGIKLLNHPNENLALQVFLPGFQDFSLSFYNIFGQHIMTREYKDYPSFVFQVADFELPKGMLIVSFRTKGRIVNKRFLNL